MKKNTGKFDFVLWARQYSKQFLTALLTMWAIGAVIGAVYEFIRLAITPETASMDAYYIYLAIPLTCGIPSYIIPNIFLNREKIRQNYIPDYDNVVLNGGYQEETDTEEEQFYGNDNGRGDQTDRMHSCGNGYGNPADCQTREIHQGIYPGEELGQYAPTGDVSYGGGGKEL